MNKNNYEPGEGLLALLKESEGLELKAYQDVVGIWTIGYGTTHVKGAGVREGMECTKEQAVEYMIDELAGIIKFINSHVLVTITQNQFDALCDFAYNLGCNALKSSTLLATLNTGNYTVAASEFLRWNHAEGQVVHGLTVRCEKRKVLFEKP
jgi:lysozyme